MTTRNLDQLIAEQNQQYARSAREAAQRLRELAEQQEFEREFAEEEKRSEGERLAHFQAFRWTERRNHLLRIVGYPTRAIVLLLLMGLWLAAWYFFLAPENISDRPLGSLTLKEIVDHLFWWGVLAWPLIMLGGLLAKYDEDDMETWGLFGLGLVAVAVLAGLWLIYS
jgi:hypothetical protein